MLKVAKINDSNVTRMHWNYDACTRLSSGQEITGRDPIANTGRRNGVTLPQVTDPDRSVQDLQYVKSP